MNQTKPFSTLPGKSCLGIETKTHCMLLSKAQERFPELGEQVLGGEGMTAEDIGCEVKTNSPHQDHIGNVEQQVTMGCCHFWEVLALCRSVAIEYEQSNRISSYHLYHLWRHLSKSWSCSLDNRIINTKYSSISTHHNLHPFL